MTITNWTAPGAPAVPASPAASRMQRARWRDPRLAVGLLLVAVSVVLGAHIVAAADVTVAMPVATVDLAAGTRLDEAVLSQRRVRISGPHPYVEGVVPAGYVIVEPVAAGELIPRAAVMPAGESVARVRYVSVPVTTAQLPAGLSRGQVVDVYLTGERGAELLASGVAVDAAAETGNTFGVHGDTVPVTLALRQTGTPEHFDMLVASVVAAGSEGTAVLVLVPARDPALAPARDAASPRQPAASAAAEVAP